MSTTGGYSSSEADALRDARGKCTWDLCHLDASYFYYRPNRAANLALAVLFGLSALAFLIQGVHGKKWVGFTIAMVGGCALEVAGYAARYVAYTELYTEVS